MPPGEGGSRAQQILGEGRSFFSTPSITCRCWRKSRVWLDYARPLAGLDLPECFDTLRRRFQGEEEKEGAGVREFIRVLRLLETTPWPRLRVAVERALQINAPQPGCGPAVFVSSLLMAKHDFSAGWAQAFCAWSRQPDRICRPIGTCCPRGGPNDRKGQIDRAAGVLLKKLKLPTMLREYASLAAVCQKDRSDIPPICCAWQRGNCWTGKKRAAERRIKDANFPVIKNHRHL